MSASARTRTCGAELNGVFGGFRQDGWSVDFLAGFRYANLRDDTLIATSTSNIGLNTVANGGGLSFQNTAFDGTLNTLDSFSTHNNFYGGNIGARAKADFGSLFLDVTGKVALGLTVQTSTINGTSTMISGGTSTTVPGGILALPSNMGTYNKSHFSVIPEVDFKVGYNFTQQVSAYVGYNFLYWSDVARSGQQIPTSVDTRQIPGVPGFTPGVATTPSAVHRELEFLGPGRHLRRDVQVLRQQCPSFNESTQESNS